MKKLLLFSLFALLASAMGWATTETWTKVTSTPDSWDGDYLIVYEAENVAFDGSRNTLDAASNTKSVTISDGTITTDDCNFYFTIANKGTIKSQSGQYIGRTSDKNGLDAKTTELTNTLSIEGGNFVVKSSGGAFLRYNKGTNDKRFRYFRSSTYTGQQPIALYKKQDAPDPGKVAAPTFTPASGSKVLYGSSVTIRSTEEGSHFVLSYSYGGIKDQEFDSNATITLPTDKTIQAITISAYAIDPTGTKANSDLVTATYFLYSNEVESISEFLKAADNTNAKTFTNPVTVVYQNGDELYVKDNTGSLVIYKSALTGLVNGDVIEAGFSGVYQLYNSLPQLTKTENLVKSATAGTPVEPTVVTIDELATADYSEYVSLKKVKYDGSNFVDLNDETKKIAAYNNKYKLVTLTAGKVYNVTGIYSIFNNVQILPLTAEELQYVADVTVSPAIGDIAKGTEVTISCATEGAVLNGTVGKEELEGQTLPYTFTASELGALKVEVYASKDGFEDSNVLTGTYNVYQPKVAALEIKPGLGTTIEVGTEITISCATEGAVLNGMIDETDVTDAALPYTFTAEKEGTISVLVSATKDGYDESDLLKGDFIVKAAVPVAYRDLITPTDLGGEGSYKDVKNVEKGGAKYKVAAYVTTNIIQFNKDKNAGLVMTTAQAAASKLIITWNKKAAGELEIYGKNTPYSAITDLNNNEGELIETVSYSADGKTTVDLGGNYTFIGIKPVTGVSYVTSIEFIWNEGAAGGADVTYTKASEAKAGNFAVLATAEGKAIGRDAELNPVEVTVSDDAIGLNKNQPKVDEFEIVEKDAANNIYQLCGGLSSDNSRRFLTYDADGVTTTAATVTKVDGKDVVSTADANADVTFESTAAGLLVKFNDGEYLMFNGTNFVKGEYTEVATQADGETLTPVIVFLSSSNVSTGVETVEFDENAAVQYFNLNGVQVKAENLTPGLYIVRQGNKVSKQVIR